MLTPPLLLFLLSLSDAQANTEKVFYFPVVRFAVLYVCGLVWFGLVRLCLIIVCLFNGGMNVIA